MSLTTFFNQNYFFDIEFHKKNIQNLAEGYFDLTSNAPVFKALKTFSFATLAIPAIALAVKAYLQHVSRASHIKKINLQAYQSFCKNHPEFSSLLQKMQNLVKFEDVDFRNGINSRRFHIGSDAIGENKVFIKFPLGKHILIRQTRAKNEQLAFLISHRLNLGVVPVTIAPEGFAHSIDAVLPPSILQYVKVGCDFKTHQDSYKGVVFQEGILLEEDQTLSNRDSLDLAQIQKAVLFNLITGRTDAQPNNTVVAQFGKIMELDNEKLGLSITDSWLLREFSELSFDPAVINDFLSKPTHTITKIFEEMNAFNFDQSMKATISENFDTIREFFLLNIENQIKVKDLKNFFINKKPEPPVLFYSYDNHPIELKPLIQMLHSKQK